MNGLFFMWAFIVGMIAVLACFYLCSLCSIYAAYRKQGLTPKQSLLTIWNLYV
jgi:cbb3-type cytochrome oxidase subunit 3